MIKIDAEFLRRERALRFISQSTFWGQFGVAQSGGSRYESGARALPKILAEQIRLFYHLSIDTSLITEANAKSIRDILDGGT